jgi:hypothetical protein
MSGKWTTATPAANGAGSRLRRRKPPRSCGSRHSVALARLHAVDAARAGFALATSSGLATKRRAMAFLATSALVVFGLFSVAGGKLGTYILPLFPSLAVLLACLLDSASRTAPGERASPGAEGEGLLYVLAAIAALSIELVFPIGLPFASALTVALGGAASAAIVFRWRRAPLRRSIAASLAAAIVAYGAVFHAGPTILDCVTAAPYIRALRETLGPDDDVALFRAQLPGVAFYTGRYFYLIGNRGEMKFGAGREPGGRFLDSMEQFRDTVAHTSKRFYCLTVTRRMKLAYIRQAFPEAHVIGSNVGFTLLVLKDRVPAA